MKYFKFFIPIFVIIGIIFFQLQFASWSNNTVNTLGLTSSPSEYSFGPNTKRINYSGTLNKIATLTMAPAGYTSVSSTTEYLYDDLGSALQNLEFANFAVKFGTCNLGALSYVQITSIEDGFVQKLNTQTLAEWRNISAFFNGRYAKIEVFKHDSETGISCAIDQLISTEISHKNCAVSSTCGNNAAQDSARIPSDHKTVAHYFGGPLSTNPNFKGLITDGGGTVWMTSNGAFASAGHVIKATGLFQIVLFNTPSSTSKGATRVPSPDHQYAIDYSSISRSYNSGNGDWAVFSVFPNPNTRLLPQEA